MSIRLIRIKCDAENPFFSKEKLKEIKRREKEQAEANKKKFAALPEFTEKLRKELEQEKQLKALKKEEKETTKKLSDLKFKESQHPRVTSGPNAGQFK